MWARSFYEVFSPAFTLFVSALSILVALSLLGGRAYRVLRIDGVNYRLLIADNDMERAKGLGSRAYLPEREGMLFVYNEPGKRCFWMKDMHFALDIIWLDGHKTITQIRSNVAPDTYPEVFCAGNSQYVIELPGGEAARRHVQPGQQVSF